MQLLGQLILNIEIRPREPSGGLISVGLLVASRRSSPVEECHELKSLFYSRSRQSSGRRPERVRVDSAALFISPGSPPRFSSTPMMFVQLNPSPMAVGEIGPIESSCYGRGKRTRAG